MTNARRNFDLPAVHIDPATHINWAPPAAHDTDEIDRRRHLPPGTLLREFQASGANVAKAIFEHPTREPEDIAHIRHNLAVALLNTSWYTFANSDNDPEIYMRRVLKLPVIADDKNEWRETKAGILTTINHGLTQTANLAQQVALQYQKGHNRARMRSEKRLGQTMGNTALSLITIHHANAPLGMSEHDIQDIVMLDASQLLEDARLSYQQTGAHMSVAQLADPYSPLSVAWRRSAPRSGESRQAITQAQADFGLSA